VRHDEVAGLAIAIDVARETRRVDATGARDPLAERRISAAFRDSVEARPTRRIEVDGVAEVCLACAQRKFATQASRASGCRSAAQSSDALGVQIQYAAATAAANAIATAIDAAFGLPPARSIAPRKPRDDATEQIGLITVQRQSTARDGEGQQREQLDSQRAMTQEPRSSTEETAAGWRGSSVPPALAGIQHRPARERLGARLGRAARWRGGLPQRPPAAAPGAPLAAGTPDAHTVLSASLRRKEGTIMIRDLIPWRRSAVAARQDPFLSFRSEFDRLFDDFFRGYSGLEVPGGLSRFAPDFDLVETDSEIRIQADVPGVEEKDIEVSLDGTLLTIKGERRAEKEEKRGGTEWSERRFGQFQRSFELPCEVQADKVKAKFKKGVLEITLPKSETARRRTVSIPIQAT
jgi:HSP20 family protein